jgi:hypothetical protein
MNRRLWLNISLAALAIALAIFVYLQHGKPSAPPLPRLTQMPAAQVKHIVISRQGEADIELERRNQGWRMTRPLQLPANETRIQSLLELLSQHSYGRFPASSVALDSIGLAPAQAVIRFDGLSMAFGLTEPLNKHRYVLINGEVQLTDDSNYYSVIAQLSRFISLRLLSADEQLESIKLPQLRLHKAESGWQVDTAQQPRLGDDLMRLVETWQSASALEVQLGDPAQAHGRTVIELGLGGDRPPIRLAILQRRPDLILLRLDNKLQYKFTAHQAEQMLQLSPDTN